MGDDVAMDSSPAPDPAELHFVELDKLLLDNWQSALERMGIRLEVVQHSYSPGAALSSHAWERGRFCTQKDICLPEFDPNCFGVPPLWNSADKESEFYGYQVCFGWGKKVAKWIPKPTQFMPNERKEFVFHVRDFLAIRPLSRDLPRFLEYWQKRSLIAAEQSRGVPENIKGRGGARSCADVFDWSRLEEFTHVCKPDKGRNQSYVCFRVPLLIGASIVNGALQSHHAAHAWEVGYHATCAYALYSQLYHGKLKQSKASVPGERACYRGDGVYLFSPKDLDSSFQYSLGTTIGWHGVVYHFIRELAFKDPVNRKMGSSKDQVVVDPGNIKLGNLIIIPRYGDDLHGNDGMYYLLPAVATDNLWCPCYEANPINPFTALCRSDQESIANPFAIKLVKSFAKARVAAIQSRRVHPLANLLVQVQIQTP